MSGQGLGLSRNRRDSRHALGPALGGTRFWNYATDEEAIVDALRLARGMTYKNAVAGLNLGGGKSVIIGDNKTAIREMIFRAHGRFVESLGGRYITAEDVGTSTADMDYVHMETDYVTGLAGRSGDPSPVTAHGVFRAIQASAKERWGSDDLSNRTVAIQGCGHVGYYLAKELHEIGAKLVVTDIDPERAKRAVSDFSARAVLPDEIYAVQADVSAPCALGAIINDKTIPQLHVEIVAGAASNPAARRATRRTRASPHSLRGGLRERRWRDRDDYSGRPDGPAAFVPEGGRKDLRHRRQGSSRCVGAEKIPTILPRFDASNSAFRFVGSLVHLPQWPKSRPMVVGVLIAPTMPTSRSRNGSNRAERRWASTWRTLARKHRVHRLADYAHPLAQKVSDGEVKRGVLLCGTGLGMSYTANRYPHVRAAVAWNPEIAKLAREHNDANILVVPARFVTEQVGIDILKTWLDTPFEGGRHARRVEKIEPKDTNT